MANVRSANTFFIDTSSSSSTPGSFITERNLKLVGILLTVGTAGSDILNVYDLDSVTRNSSGQLKLELKSDTGNDTRQFRLADAPIVFPNGVWVAVTGAAKATLIFTQQGNS